MRFDAVPLDVAGRPFFLCFSLGALQILQKRLGLKNVAETMQRLQGVLPGKPSEDGSDDPMAAAVALQEATLRADLDDLAEILWCGLLQSGIAEHYRTPQQLMNCFAMRDLAVIVTKIGVCAALSFASPDSEAATGEAAANPQEAAPNP